MGNRKKKNYVVKYIPLGDPLLWMFVLRHGEKKDKKS